MKKIIAFFLLVLCLSVPVNGFEFMGGKPPVVVSCTLYDSFTDAPDTHHNVGRYVNNEYSGTVFNDAAAGGDICQIDWYFTDSNGTPNANDLYAEIWTMTGDDLNAMQSRSEKIDGADWDADVWVEFIFSTSFTYLQNTNYAVTVKSIDNNDAAATVAEFDGTDWYKIGYVDENDDTVKTFGRRTWAADKTSTSIDLEDDMGLKIYTDQ